MHNILLVEDSFDYQLLISSVLKRSDCLVEHAVNGAEAIKILQNKTYDLVILDMFLPDMSGMKIMEFIKISNNISNTPVFFLTSDEELTSKLNAFSLGADDYLVKPINPEELQARVMSKLHKTQKTVKSNDSFSTGNISINIPLFKATLHQDAIEEPLDLTAKEFKILCLLAQNSGKIFNRAEIVKTVWGEGVHILDRTVDSHICSLRRKMKSCRNYIQSISSEGYCFTLSAKK